jgi:hypothetical protein
MSKKTAPPRRVELQDRDRAFLKALYDFDGVLPERHVRDQFYPGIGDKSFDARMRKLRDAHYILYPTRQQRQEHPVPEKIYWLAVKGITEIAASAGVEAGFPKKLTDNALDDYRRRLKRAGIHWVREPHWRYLKHHIQICDVRFTACAAAQAARLTWGGWIPESRFRADRELQTISYTVKERRPGGQVVELTKHEPVYPDGFFFVSRPVANQPGKVDDFFFLIEVDRGTESGPRIVQEKIIRGEAYLKSDSYSQLTGAPKGYGRWLLVTTSQERAANLKRLAEQANRKPSFYFASFADLSATSFFVEPIWMLKGRAEPLPLLPPAK